MPRLTALSDKLTTVGSKKTPVFIKTYTGTDFSSYHSTWTFSTGTISLRSSTLPYHSYGNDMDPNTATNQLCNKTWPIRSGLAIATTATDLYPFVFDIINTSTTATVTVLTLSTAPTDAITIGMPLAFSETAGGVSLGQTYYVKNVVTTTSSNSSTLVTLSKTLNGAPVKLVGSGTNYATTLGITSATTNIGYWLNGVNMYDPSAGTEAPNGYLTFNNLSYDAAYETNLEYSYSLEQDFAGGHVTSNGNYHYHNFSFAKAWITGSGHASGVYGTTGTAEVSLISYLNGDLINAEGHSKILGWSLDGYPVYGPYGYNQATDCNSGVRTMVSGYAKHTKVADVPGRVVDGALNTTVYPLGIFVEDYYYAGGGDLDVSNGRYCVTPEYPQGTYAYFCTVDPETLSPVYPYVLGNVFKSVPVGSGQTTSNNSSGGGSAPKQTS